MYVRAHIKVHGMVQGVGFRYFAARQANALDLKGYVRNMHDETVESEVEGHKADVEEYIKSLRRGPSFSAVKDLKVNWLRYSGEYQDFRITY